MELYLSIPGTFTTPAGTVAPFPPSEHKHMLPSERTSSVRAVCSTADTMQLTGDRNDTN
jgi:hypothetical protein